MQSIIDTIWNFCRDHLGTALTSVIGTFFGVSVAFYVERWKAKKATRSAQRSALLEAQLVLMCHANSLYDFLSWHESYRDDPARERHIPLRHYTFDEVSLDPRKLSFLADGPMPDLVLQTYVADRAYLSACRSLEVRNQVFQHYFASMDVHEFDLDTGAARGIDHLPTRKLLKDATDSMFNSLDDAFAQNMKMIRELRDVSRRLFKESPLYLIEFQTLPSQKMTKHESNKEV